MIKIYIIIQTLEIISNYYLVIQKNVYDIKVSEKGKYKVVYNIQFQFC